MGQSIKILAFAGSSRSKSLNQGILRAAIEGAKAAGAEVEHIDLRALALPLMDEDLEAEHGEPEGVPTRLKSAMRAADGFLVASPEYNSSITPLLKNSMDWASRSAPGDPPGGVYRGKVAAFMSASAGAFGGIRALPHVRWLFENLGTMSLPAILAMPRITEDSFDSTGRLIDDSARQRLEGHGAEAVRVIRALRA